ncbi:MAG TPA: YebC/PmpR family DNA-binding transcriptional regulator [Candidatus Magasanikbacteria bacterium]|nr:YebC/PmpR family DNA-binding transcriptional regulator [Candidatus Magasanikbacteria bacterium]
MSGHSKWHNIQAKKGKADKARSNVFTKIARMITVAVQQGGGDSTMNFTLRLAIDKAKAANMPKENIDRAIKRGTGELDDGTTLQELLYEGFGPGGVAILVEVVTDNPNRSASEVKNVFSKKGGSMGGPGSVKWQFSRLGVVRLGTNEKLKIENKKSDFELALIEAGADDIEESEMGIEIRCAVEKFKNVLDVVQSFGLEPDDSGLQWIAKEDVSIDAETSAKVQQLYDAFDELDDVREVYTNEA